MTTEVEVTKDQRTATAEGESAQSLISGVLLRRQPPLEDERGEIVEVYRPSWGVHQEPLVYVYQIGIRPGKVKGWSLHRHQDDRLFLINGTVRWALFDDRPESHSYQMLNVLTVSERSRSLLIIPRHSQRRLSRRSEHRQRRGISDQYADSAIQSRRSGQVSPAREERPHPVWFRG